MKGAHLIRNAGLLTHGDVDSGERGKAWSLDVCRLQSQPTVGRAHAAAALEGSWVKCMLHSSWWS